MKYLSSIKDDMKENKIIINNNFKCILIYIVILSVIPLLCKIELFNNIYTKINKYNIISIAIFLSICIIMTKINYKFIKAVEKKIYNIILNIIIPIIIMFFVSSLIFNIINNIAQTNISRFWRIPYLYSDYKYEIEFKPFSYIEESSDYTYYIDLKRKEVTRIVDNYWIRDYVSRNIEQKKIDESTNNKLVNLLKEIDSMKEKKDNEKNGWLEMMEEHYYVSTNKYKQKKVNYNSKREIMKELEKIFNK